MAFAFAAGERIDVGARRLAREGAEKIVSTLHDPSDPEASVHDARRMLKRLRALVRLIHASIGDSPKTGDARAADTSLREAARALSVVRDAAVVLATFEGLAPDAPDARAAASVRASLRRARARSAPVDLPAVLEHVRAFEASVEHWTFRDDGWKAIEPGVLRTYRQGRRALAHARETSESTVLHDLRKRCKDLQFQLALLREIFPHVVSGYHEAASDLGELLGQDHDLAVLADTLKRRRTLDVTQWIERIEERRLSLRTQAFPLAEKLWLDRPRVWTRRLAFFWSHA